MTDLLETGVSAETLKQLEREFGPLRAFQTDHSTGSQFVIVEKDGFVLMSGALTPEKAARLGLPLAEIKAIHLNYSLDKAIPVAAE